MSNDAFAAARYQVTAVDPEDNHRWQQAIVIASSEAHAKLVMRERLAPKKRDHWSITWVGKVSPYADESGSLHGD